MHQLSRKGKPAIAILSQVWALGYDICTHCSMASALRLHDKQPDVR